MNPFGKQAGPYVAGVSPETADFNNSLKAEALRRALKAGLLGLGGGAGLAGLLGARQLFGKTDLPSYPLQTEIDLPYPQVASEEEKDRKRKKSELRQAEKASSAEISPAPLHQIVGTPALAGAMGGAVGLRSAEDPVQGALYGGARGVMRGVSYAPGAVAGGLLADRLMKLKGPAALMGAASSTGKRLGLRLGRSTASGLSRLSMAAGGKSSPVDLAKRLSEPLADSLGELPARFVRILGGATGGVTSRKALNPFVDAASEKLLGPPPKLKRPASKLELHLTGEDPKVWGEKAVKKADLADAAVNGLGLATRAGDRAATVGSPSWLRGDSAGTPAAVPWAIPAAAGAAGAGIFGGHALVRHLLKRKRKADLQRQLEAAQQEYEESMLAQYDPTKLRKITGAKEASAPENALDACYAYVAKEAGLFNDLAGGGAGLYLTGAGLLGLGAGVGTYKWLENRSQHKVLKDALKRRALLRALANPPDMNVRPVPVEYVDSEPDKTDRAEAS